MDNLQKTKIPHGKPFSESNAKFIFPYDGMIRIRFAGQGVTIAQSQPEASGTPKKVLYAVVYSIKPQKRFVKPLFL